MPRIFVSHAYSDRVLVDPFVDTVLRLGCGLSADDLFYSSGEDTGIKDGDNLLDQVRQRVSEAGLVIAMISPVFQTRPVCVAELGAAWSRAGHLFPLAVPEMERTDMEGVLSGMLVRYINDQAALDALHDRVSELRGERSATTTWGRYKARWLANVAAYADQLKSPDVFSSEDVARLEADLDGTRSALTESETENRDLRERLDKLAAATGEEERRQALLPTDEKERFDALVKLANEGLRKLDPIVREAVYYDLCDGSMPWPNAYSDKDRNEEAHTAVHNGDLYENSDGQLSLDTDTTDVANAQIAVADLQEMLTNCSEEFDTWFRHANGNAPNLTRKRVWDAVIL